MDILIRFLPNVVKYQQKLLDSAIDTLIMVAISSIISIIIGTILGIMLVVTAEGKLYENTKINNLLGKFINVFRSIPFVIIITLILPFTKFIVGTSIGVKGAIVPMIVGIVPFIARQIEQALFEVDNGVIEAARAMGMSKLYIIYRVLIKEGMPGIIRALVISIISLINLSAMAGTVGGGGLGDFAVRYGYAQYMTDITLVTVTILLILVAIVQGVGNILIKRMRH
jgi:D-methionine transport system permease protein